MSNQIYQLISYYIPTLLLQHSRTGRIGNILLFWLQSADLEYGFGVTSYSNDLHQLYKLAQFEMKQQKQNKPQQKPFFCPNKKPAQFCCSQPNCKQIAIKCLASSQCSECKKNHNRCPRQIRITNIIELAKKKQKESIPKMNKVTEEDLIQKLINQLTETKKRYLKIDNKKWGMRETLSSLIFEKDVSNKMGNDVADFLSSDIIYPELRFYKPPQFRKDAEELQKINREFQKRMLEFHKIYQSLAECSCELTRQERNGALHLNQLVELHIKFKQAIIQRLNVSPMFGKENEAPTKDEISNFKHIGVKIFMRTYQGILAVSKNNKQYGNALSLVVLALDMFNPDRKQYALEDKDAADIAKNREKIVEIEAFLSYEVGDYWKAYDYYSKLKPEKQNTDVLKKLITICEQLSLSSDIYLNYLLLLEQLQVDSAELLQKIIKRYQQKQNNEKIHQYYKKLNVIESRGAPKKEKLLGKMKRYKWLTEYEQKKFNETTVLTTISDALKYIIQGQEDFQVIEIGLELRYKMALIHRYISLDNSESSNHGVKICETLLPKVEKIYANLQKIKRDNIISVLKNYQVKFLLLCTQTEKNQHRRLNYLEKTVKVCEELNIKIFQPYYQLAKITFEIGNENSKDWQTKALKIYPTHICYSNLAYILYQSHFKNKHPDFKQLRECIDCIKKSLALKPDQIELYQLRALANQNLKNYKQSNVDLDGILDKLSGKRKFDAQRRMAENYLFILKAQANIIKQEQKNEIIKKAHRLYSNCLAESKDDQKCLLGYGRVLKLMKKFAQAEEILNLLTKSMLKNEAYMELGNIKQQLGKQNDERDFNLLEEALAMYRLAGTSLQNYENLKRIYLELDEPKKAEEMQAQILQMQRRRAFNR